LLKIEGRKKEMAGAAVNLRQLIGGLAEGWRNTSGWEQEDREKKVIPRGAVVKGAFTW
jgi:hypothetical protein